MRVEVCHPKELGPDHIGRWRAWQESDARPGAAFLSATFVMLVGELRDDARVAVITEGGVPVAYFPFQDGRMGFGRALAFGVSDRQGLVHCPGFEYDPIDLIRDCGLRMWEFDHVGADDGALAVHVSSWATGSLMDVSGGYDEYLKRCGQGSGRYVKSAMQKQRKLEREHGELSMDFDSKDDGALRVLFDWKSEQYIRTGRSDRFANDWIRDLIEAIAETREPDCTGVLSVLRAGDEIAALHFGMRTADELSLWFPAYNTELSKYSPGAQLFLHLAKSSGCTGITRLDLGKGDEDYKGHLRTGEYRVGRGAVMTSAPATAVGWLRHGPKDAVEGFVLRHQSLRLAARKGLNAVGTVRARRRQ